MAGRKPDRAYDERGNVRPADGRWTGTRIPAKKKAAPADPPPAQSPAKD